MDLRKMFFGSVPQGRSAAPRISSADVDAADNELLARIEERVSKHTYVSTWVAKCPECGSFYEKNHPISPVTTEPCINEWHAWNGHDCPECNAWQPTTRKQSCITLRECANPYHEKPPKKWR